MPARSRAAAVTLAGVIGIVFATPLRGIWARDDGPWWLVFAVWLPIIVAIGWFGRERRD